MMYMYTSYGMGGRQENVLVYSSFLAPHFNRSSTNISSSSKSMTKEEQERHGVSVPTHAIGHSRQEQFGDSWDYITC